jgi:isopropylmalate/homocitrate/citramalate synthase
MPEYSINPERNYCNFNGELPPVGIASEPAEMPAPAPHNSPKVITDTTLRDGAQDPTFAILPNETKLKYFDLLHKLDNGTGVIESVEVFIYQKRDVWTLEKLLERGYEYPRVTTWTRAIPKDIRDLVKISQGRIKETGMLASSSDHHIFDRLSYRSKEDAVEKYLAPILTACEEGIRPRVHLEDATRADVRGWVIPFVARVFEETKGQALFRICDTLGVGHPDPYAELPFGVPRLVSEIAAVSPAELEFHGHNDFGNATANSMAALRYGCRKVNTAFGGLGERTGNAALEQVIANYIREYGNPGLKLEVLAEIAQLMDAEVTPVSPKQPVVGSHIFTTQAGLHQSGVHRQDQAPGGLIYLPYDPAVVGRSEETLHRIGALSGMDGIIALLNDYFKAGQNDARELSGTSRAVKLIYDKIQEAYDGQYDPSQDRYLDYRTTFFEIEELVQLFG